MLDRSRHLFSDYVLRLREREAGVSRQECEVEHPDPAGRALPTQTAVEQSGCDVEVGRTW